jgi:hypothetical protein
MNNVVEGMKYAAKKLDWLAKPKDMDTSWQNLIITTS